METKNVTSKIINFPSVYILKIWWLNLSVPLVKFLAKLPNPSAATGQIYLKVFHPFYITYNCSAYGHSSTTHQSVTILWNTAVNNYAILFISGIVMFSSMWSLQNEILCEIRVEQTRVE